MTTGILCHVFLSHCMHGVERDGRRGEAFGDVGLFAETEIENGKRAVDGSGQWRHA